MTTWYTDPPPSDFLVLVRNDVGEVLKARARWGHDGSRPHWEGEGGKLYPCEAFVEWAFIEDEQS